MTCEENLQLAARSHEEIRGKFSVMNDRHSSHESVNDPRRLWHHWSHLQKGNYEFLEKFQKSYYILTFPNLLSACLWSLRRDQVNCNCEMNWKFDYNYFANVRTEQGNSVSMAILHLIFNGVEPMQKGKVFVFLVSQFLKLVFLKKCCNV